MAITLLALPSCKSLDSAIVASATSLASAAIHTHDTLVVRDTILTRDSVVVRERTIHDTVYITKEIYRDAHHSSLIAHNSTKADTVVVTDTIVQVIDHPPEKYIPPFYKHCTTILFIILAAGIVYLVIRCRLHL